MFAGAEAATSRGPGGADSSSGGQGGQEVVPLKQSDFVLLVLLLFALFYGGVAVIYRLALGRSKEERLRQKGGAKRD